MQKRDFDKGFERLIIAPWLHFKDKVNCKIPGKRC